MTKIPEDFLNIMNNCVIMAAISNSQSYKQYKDGFISGRNVIKRGKLAKLNIDKDNRTLCEDLKT